MSTKEDKKKQDDVPETNSESSYKQIMKYLKTQEDAEQKRNQNRTEENWGDKNGVDTPTPTKPNRKSSGDTIPKNKNNGIDVTDSSKEYNQDPNENNMFQDKISDIQVVPDRSGFRSVGTQTLRVREPKTCNCCCTCNNSS